MNRKLSSSTAGSGGAHVRDDDYRQLVSEHLTFLEKQCVRAVARRSGENGFSGGIDAENEALELYNAVLDILQRDHYRVVREFESRSAFKTYLTAIVSRQAVEMIRKKRGRRHDEEQARKMGDIGLFLYRRVIREGVSVDQASRELAQNGAGSFSPDVLTDMVDKIRGRPGNAKTPVLEGGPVWRAVAVKDNEWITPDPGGDPGARLMEEERGFQIRKALACVLEALSGEELFLLKTRFPVEDGARPQPVEKIAGILGIHPKAVYKRTDRLMDKCRRLLNRQGVAVDELF